MDRLDGLLANLKEVRDGFQRHPDFLAADRTTPAPGEDRPHLIGLLEESVRSFTLALERFKPQAEPTSPRK